MNFKPYRPALVSTFISEAMVGFLSVGKRLLLQAKEFKYLRVLLTMEGKPDYKTDRLIGTSRN